MALASLRVVFVLDLRLDGPYSEVTALESLLHRKNLYYRHLPVISISVSCAIRGRATCSCTVQCVSELLESGGFRHLNLFPLPLHTVITTSM